VKALSSSPSTAKRKKESKRKKEARFRKTNATFSLICGR
jgi:hypothetical protein